MPIYGIHGSREEVAKSLEKDYRVPIQLVDGLLRYSLDRVETGSFLRSVLENDLYGAVCRADASSLVCLAGVAKLVRNELPADCQGSSQNVDAWLAGQKGLPLGAARRMRHECPQCRQEDALRRDAHEAGANLQSLPIYCPHPIGTAGC